MPHIRRSLLTTALAALAVALLPGAPRPAYAATYVVTTLADSGPGSLRQAILDANATPGADTITFSLSGTITLASALPTITDPAGLTIDGSGQTVVVSGDNAVRPFGIASDAFAELRRLTITKGANGQAGAIYNQGTLNVVDSTVSDNGSLDGSGGIFNDYTGALTVANSIVSSNRSVRFGVGGILNLSGTLTVTSSTVDANVRGGIRSTGGTVTVSNSTISNNTIETGSGAGIDSFGTLTVSNTTITGNISGATNGGIFSAGPLTLTNSTVSNNRSLITPAGIGSTGGFTMANSILAGNTVLLGSGPDCNGSPTATGPNLIGDPSLCIVTGIPPIAGPALLGPLADNGGPTKTHALLAGSPAIDAGDDAICAVAPVSGKDQRGVVRPQGAHCDLGAFELQASATPLTNGDFEDDATGWTLASLLDGIARIEVEGSCFGANNTKGINFNGGRALNVRSSPSAPVGSTGIATSSPFAMSTAVSFRALIENDDAVPSPDPVSFEVRVLDAGGGLLATHPVKPAILTTSPGTSNDGCLVGDLRDGPRSTHTVDTSAYAGQLGRIEFRQHTNVPGKGFFALVDDVVVAP